MAFTLAFPWCEWNLINPKRIHLLYSLSDFRYSRVLLLLKASLVSEKHKKYVRYEIHSLFIPIISSFNFPL